MVDPKLPKTIDLQKDFMAQPNVYSGLLKTNALRNQITPCSFRVWRKTATLYQELQRDAIICYPWT